MTFLLTELIVDGSLRARGEGAFAAALQSYHELLRPLLRGHGGHEMPANAEVMHLVFGRASDALAAAVAGQRALATHAWPEDAGALRVRMALHTGEVAPGDNGSESQAFRTATGLLLAAHAGQILLSGATAGLMSGLSEMDVRLVDLGSYRLPGGGLESAVEVLAERIFQVHDPEIAPQEFPPPNALPSLVGNLPLQFTRFFGREDEIGRLRGLLLNPETRLVMLTGPGGTGKTRLALEVALRLREPLRGAVWFVPLAALSEAGQIVDKVLDALRLTRSPDLEPLEQVAGALSRQPALLLLDNLEHLLPAGASLVRTLLERVVTLTCLVTSRQRLDLAGEREFLVAPLPTPSETDTPEGLAGYASVQLLVDRAQAVRPDFQVTRTNAAAVAALCRRLEGIPLALELAAARAQALTPAQMLARLANRYEFLVSRQRDAAPRHGSLRAAIGWSYELLASELQRFFAQLCVFRGGWTLAAAEAVCEERLALDYLEQLRRCTLVVVEEQDEQGRYRLLETLREYADEQLTPEERIALRCRHLHYYLEVAGEAEPHLWGAEFKDWLDRLEAEHDNLRAALAWSLESGEAEAGLRLAAAVWRFWAVRGDRREGQDWFQRVLAQEGAQERTAARAKALYGAGQLAWQRLDLELSRSLLQESIATARELGEQRVTARSLLGLAFVVGRQGDHPMKGALCEEGLAIGRELGDPWIIANALHCLGTLAHEQGDYGQARSLFGQGLALFRKIGDPWSLMDALGALGAVASHLGDHTAARSLHEEALALCGKLGYPLAIPGRYLALGDAARRRGDYAAAQAFYEKSLSLWRDTGRNWCISLSLAGLSAVAAAQGQPERAARLLGTAAALREASGGRLAPADRDAYERQVAATRAELGEEAFAAAWAAGRAMDLEQALAYAIPATAPA